MTREEREKAITELSDIYTGNYRLAEALKCAIEALKAEPPALDDMEIISNALYNKLIEQAAELERIKAEPHYDEWCTDCKEYDREKNCCPRFNRVIRNTVKEMKVESCEDAIDRSALRARFNHLDELYEWMSEEEKHEAYIYGQIIRAIDDAPPVTPEIPTSVDAVSREDIKKIAKEMYLEVGNMELDVHTISDCISYTASKCRQVLVDKLNNLPPVISKPRTGHWIRNQHLHFMHDWKCSECGHVEHERVDTCPNCHADMREEKE